MITLVVKQYLKLVYSAILIEKFVVVRSWYRSKGESNKRKISSRKYKSNSGVAAVVKLHVR